MSEEEDLDKSQKNLLTSMKSRRASWLSVTVQHELRDLCIDYYWRTRKRQWQLDLFIIILFI